VLSCRLAGRLHGVIQYLTLDTQQCEIFCSRHRGRPLHATKARYLAERLAFTEFIQYEVTIMHDDAAFLYDVKGLARVAAFEHFLLCLERYRHAGPFDGLALEHPTECCVGIGYGEIFAIGPNLAQGDEMNQASKLGEDIARANETLLTERTFEALRERRDIRFQRQSNDDQLFPFYSAVLRA